MGSGNFVTSNNVNNNTYYGIVLIATNGNTVNLNTISANGLDALALDNLSAFGGPIANGSTGNFIKGNIISSMRDGIFVGQLCINNQITNANQITGSGVVGAGINLWRSGSQIITDNTVSAFNTGIRLLGSSDNTITGNTVTGNANGFKIDPSWQLGIWYQSLNNTISGNNISANTAYGMLIGDQVN
ncbi:MAG: right-handed parallel beta-helix repeat-containing protein [Saprospiraceae bacterium]|nr:right-handed parallel beta-helix repeat-containing protein [Saprospiraceae bacterium]